MDTNEALANLSVAINEEAARRAEADSQGYAYSQDDEQDDELGEEFCPDPTLGHVLHLMDMLDLLNTPAPEPRPVYRP